MTRFYSFRFRSFRLLNSHSFKKIAYIHLPNLYGGGRVAIHFIWVLSGVDCVAFNSDIGYLSSLSYSEVI